MIGPKFSDGKCRATQTAGIKPPKIQLAIKASTKLLLRSEKTEHQSRATSRPIPPTMAPTRLAAPPTCLSCLRRLALPSPSAFPSLRPLAQQQTRGVKMTKAEQEDLQGIPVRLLHDMNGFGRKDSIIRVKAGRMRNQWFPKAQAEYMTKQRFKELGLTEAAIGVRDRSFGIRLLADEKAETATPTKRFVKKSPAKEVLTLSSQETLSLLTTHVPSTLTFVRKPIQQISPPPAPDVEPAPVRSPSLARHALTSTEAVVPEAVPAEPAAVAIFGSVSALDVLAVIKERLLELDPVRGGRIALEAEGIEIRGLEKGEDRIKHLGTFEVYISVSKDLDPIKLAVNVVAEE
ncbi:hypothetical protein F4781DRAFT_417151 [Annulohypoxylon bovei var. microspora]|nr:hypothetical protein F4781DRAFT_417151 [Annulohypoxylon bovei var. microspora]